MAKKLKNRIEDFDRLIKNSIHQNGVLDKLAFYFYGLFWILRAKFVFKNVSANKNIDKKILILAIRAIPSTNLVYFDAIFAQAFRLLGCDVKMLYCDGFMDSCDADTAFRNQKAQCFVCNKCGKSVKKTMAVDDLSISYKDYISDSEVSEIKKEVGKLSNEELLNYNYLGVDVSSHAKASAARYFLYGKIDLSKDSPVLREKLVYSMIAAKIAQNVINKENPDTIIMLHGIYSTWGPFLSYFRLKGRETYVYDNKLSRFGNFTFFHNCEAFKTFGQSWADFKDLSKEEESEINAYLNERFKGKVGEYLMYKGDFEDPERTKILKSLFRDNYKRRYVLFPNVGWDGSIKGDISNIFDDMFDWVDKTVEFFKEHKDYQLIIKSHPAELIFVSQGKNKSIAEYIIERHSPLPSNITILMPDTPLKAYDLIGPDIVSITYDGTIGLELGTLGLPAIVVSETHYGTAGVAKKIETKEDYFNLIENPNELIEFAKKNINLAKKYAYFYFFKSMVRVPFYRNDRWSTIDWSKINKELFKEDSNLIKICRRIINNQDVINPL